MRGKNVPEWGGQRGDNSGGDEDQRGNDSEAHVHRVTNLRRSMGLCERREKVGWEVGRLTESMRVVRVLARWATKAFANQ
jgi:hypothetical protein